MSHTPSKNTDTQTMSGFSNVLQNYEKSIAHLLQTKYGITPQEFMISAINAIKKTPKLLQCDAHSLFGAILLSAECGLRFNTPEQHAFILPYKGKAQFQIGYKGLIEIMYRNERVRTINAVAVYDKDEFDYGYGLDPYLNHKPYRGKDRGELKATYAVCKLRDADPIFTVVEDYELEEIKKFSQSKDSEYSPYNSGADVFHFMEIKASIKKLSKLIPKQGAMDMVKAVDYDSRFEGGGTITAPVLTSPDELATATVLEGTNSGGITSAFDEAPTQEKKEELPPAKEPVNFEKPQEEPVPVAKEDEQSEIDFAMAGNQEVEEIDNSLTFDLPSKEEAEEESVFQTEDEKVDEKEQD